MAVNWSVNLWQNLRLNMSKAPVTKARHMSHRHAVHSSTLVHSFEVKLVIEVNIDICRASLAGRPQVLRLHM